MTIFNNLARNSSSLSFIAEDERRFSYSDLLNNADHFAEKINERSLIFIISSNNFACVTGYVGALRANAVVVLINYSIHESMWKDLIKNYKPAFIYQPKNLFQCEKDWEQKFKFGRRIKQACNN